MRTSFSSIIHCRNAQGEFLPLDEIVKFFGESGIEVMDLTLCAASDRNGYTFMAQDNWRDEIKKVGEAAQKYGVDIATSHLPYFNLLFPDNLDLEYQWEMLDRCIEASAMLGCKYTAFHPGYDPTAVLSREASKRGTIEKFTPHLNHARELGVTVCIENLFVPHKYHTNHRYCSTVDDVVDLVETLGDDVGVCWDTGHANLSGDDQAECLRVVGNRLKMTHIHDNNGDHDHHIAPFMGKTTVDWAHIMPTLAQIGYKGDFNYELGGGKMPYPLHSAYVEFLKAEAKYLISLAK